MKSGPAIAGLLLCTGAGAGAEILAMYSPATTAACTSRHSLTVLRGNQLPELLGSRIDGIRLYRSDDGQLRPVPVQIDRKDEANRYLLEDEAAEAGAVLGENDEIVFLQAETGDRLPDGGSSQALVELELTGAPGQPAAWLYAQAAAPADDTDFDHSVRYYPESNSVRTDLYTIGFSASHPFLINSLSWKLPDRDDWSPDISDTMKIRHQGSLFGFMDFRRTQDDYQSRLVAVKGGPLRVILRTENRVRIWWKLDTPALYIDYVMMPDGFVMDSIIDIPFNIGLFMSDLETLTTVDWNQSPDLPALFISSPYTGSPLPVNGSMSPKKWHFSGLHGDHFAVSSIWGTLDTRLEIPPEFPLEASLYLRDNVTQPDPPEERIGQFGNVGFLTTGWENIDTEAHHLKFTVCMSQ